MACGAALAPPAASRPAGAREERKTVTVLFCDVVGFTAMSEAADPEDVEAVLGRYHEAVRREVERHGGVVEKYIGDAVVGVFGVPAAHEDDAERAVRAGLRVVESVEGVTRPDGAPLQVRVGVNTGEAFVRLDVDPASGRGLVTGDAVNTAARLQTAAAPMSVIVGPLTRELTGDVIVYDAFAPVLARGKTRPVGAWLVTGRRSRTGLRTAASVRGPFLGRARELEALRDAARAAWEAREAHFVLVAGEPGIGKSRLVLEFFREVERSAELITWRQGRCLAYGDGVTFWALGEILREHAGVVDSDGLETVEAKLEAVLPDGQDRPWLRQRLRPLLGLEAAQASRPENFAAWTRFTELIARGRPMVLVLEDLHWAGEGMLAFVEHLLARELPVPLLVVATTRLELLQRRTGPLTEPGGGPRRARIDLPALSADDTRALVSGLLGAEGPANVDHQVAALCGGNPLYTEQYVRLLLDGGYLADASPSPDLRGDAGLPLPATVHAVLSARLDALPRELKAMLGDAAVLGEAFWRGGGRGDLGPERGARRPGHGCPDGPRARQARRRPVHRERARVPLLARPRARRGVRCAPAPAARAQARGGRPLAGRDGRRAVRGVQRDPRPSLRDLPRAGACGRRR